MNVRTWVILSLAALVALAPGCRWPSRNRPAPPPPPLPAPPVDPLVGRQREVYPELAGGRFLCLADFEGDAGAGGDPNVVAVSTAFDQLRRFRVEPDISGASWKLATQTVRTGGGSLEAFLPPRTELVFDLPSPADIRPFRLLSVSVFCRFVRDDLRISLDSDAGTWRSPRELVQPGWNTVLVDLRRPGGSAAGLGAGGFDAGRVRRVRLGFTDAAGPVWIHVDDVMLIDNARRIEPSPPGTVLRKSGLDYTLSGPAWPEPLRLARGADGLWRMSGVGAEVRLAAPGEKLSEAGEKLDVLGPRRVGLVELLEHNAMRVRFGCTWFFPVRAGQSVSLPARRITWEYTIYSDGRCAVRGELNNAGGREIASAVIATKTEAAFHGRFLARRIELFDFAGEVGRWQYLAVPAGGGGKAMAEDYLRPGSVRISLGEADAVAAGDYDRDGFDESQGCYFLGSRAGLCRFVLDPPPGGLIDPLLRLTSTRPGELCVSSEGLAIRSAVRLADGSVLVRLPGRYIRPTKVEASGL